jgi:hypothetical protein
MSTSNFPSIWDDDVFNDKSFPLIKGLFYHKVLSLGEPLKRIKAEK